MSGYNFVVAGTTPTAQKTSTGTSDIQTFSRPTSDAPARAFLITVETTAARVTVDGSVPSSSNGHLIPVGIAPLTIICGDHDVKFASSASANSVVNITWLG